MFRAALFLLILASPLLVAAQVQRPTDPIRSSPAYAEILLRTTELKAELESISDDYTDTSFRVMDLRLELDTLNKAASRILAVRPSDSGKLTLALGKLLVRKAALDAELARLARNYKPEHTDVKRTKKKADVFESAIREILP